MRHSESVHDVEQKKERACDKSRQSQDKSTCCWQTDDIMIDVYNAQLKLAAGLIKQEEIVKKREQRTNKKAKKKR